MTTWAPKLSPKDRPVYLAIAHALARDVEDGTLPPGTRLPTHRDLADRLGVTIGTVTRAYAEAARRGLVSGEVGRGTFTRAGSADPSPVPSTVVDLSLNLPPELPAALGRSLPRTLTAIAQQADPSALLGYAPDTGSTLHREAGVAWAAVAGLATTTDRVVVTSGSQHALAAVLMAAVRPGDLVLTECLTYPGLKALCATLDVRLQGLPIDDAGLRPDALAAALERGGVRALVCVPTLHNPTAAVMPEARRREIARLCQQHDVLVVEDDVYGLLAEDAPAPLASHAPEHACYVVGTAKTLAPGLRTAFVVAPARLVAPVASAVRATTWMAAPLMVEIVARWIKDGTARRILDARRAEARARLQVATDVFDGWRLSAPRASPHLWLHLREPWRSESFAEEARRRGVLVTPAQAFAVGRVTVPHAVRVCLGGARDRDELARALRVLATLPDAAASASAAAMIV